MWQVIDETRFDVGIYYHSINREYPNSICRLTKAFNIYLGIPKNIFRLSPYVIDFILGHLQMKSMLVCKVTNFFLYKV